MTSSPSLLDAVRNILDACNFITNTVEVRDEDTVVLDGVTISKETTDRQVWVDDDFVPLVVYWVRYAVNPVLLVEGIPDVGRVNIECLHLSDAVGAALGVIIQQRMAIYQAAQADA